MNPPFSASPRIIVLGAGVIGQVYASLLHRIDAQVTLIARGLHRKQLRNNGVHLLRQGIKPQKLIVPVPVEYTKKPTSADIVLLTVRTQQLPGALEIRSRDYRLDGHTYCGHDDALN